jgi:hypothetical protein
MPSETGFSDADAHIAALADRYAASPDEADEAGKAALAFILQDIDRIMARLDVGIADEKKKMAELLENLKRPTV